MKFRKNSVLAVVLAAAMSLGIVFGLAGCADEKAAAVSYGEECYEKLEYIDKNLRDRDCRNGENFKLAQRWIAWELIKCGYEEKEILNQPVTFNAYLVKGSENVAANGFESDGKTYNKSGRKYVEAEGDTGEYVYGTVTSYNLVLKKQGKSAKQIIVGAHYDGTGTGDNGSGVALALTTAQKLINVETEYTIVFVFFTAEEIGCYGSSQYAENMTDGEVADTLYMINLDSLVCGDYTYLYGGVQDNENKVVTKTEAYDNAIEIAGKLGLEFKSNPWSWDNLSPEDKKSGAENPSYAAPSTGDWSDHRGFKKRGITYLYMEATNWEIPDYTGYGETYLIGMLMNTENDYLEYIEKYFPGRPLEHLTKYSALLYALVTQSGYNA